MENVLKFEDVDQSIIDNEFTIEQEFDGMKCEEYSMPITDLDFTTSQS
tara:strand:+ start:1890 stop:2033 length:144 start_codon:yes stop_codon:yes gene_type:complete